MWNIHYAVVLCCITINAQQGSFNFKYSQPHKIRHLRHLLRSARYQQQSDRPGEQCRVEPWGSRPSAAALSGCPREKCRSNPDCWQFAKTNLCICDPHLCGLVCLDHDLRCQIPRHPEHGKAILQDLRVGDQVEYSCQNGFAVKGPRKRYCQANLQLSGPEPECTDQTDFCFTPPYIPNSVVADGNSRSDYRNGESVRIACQKGFEDRRHAYMIATCVGNEWRYSPLKCDRISCGKLQDPKDGRTMYTDSFSYQSNAIPFCNDGFRLHCSVVTPRDDKPCKRICEADGRWDGVDATCKPILCPNLRVPSNGVMEGSSNKVNNIRRFRCNKGYQLAGSYLRNCQLNGEWDGWIATCNIRDCGPHPKVAFSSVTSDKTTYLSMVIYRCDGGTTLAGKSAVLTCQEKNNSSTWLPEPPPRCVRHCTPLKVTHASSVRVQPSSNTLVGAPTQNIPIYEVRHGSSVFINCSTGFELDHVVRPLCNNGTWSYIPRCIEASCPKRPDAESNSLVRFYSLKHDEMARYYCHYGYRVLQRRQDGATTYSTHYDIRCLKGNWTKGPEGGCVPTKCEMPSSPKNGRVYLKGEGDRTELTGNTIRNDHGRVIEYECLPDYRLRGSKIAVCLNEAWSPPETPWCEFIMHDELPISWLFYDSSSATAHRRIRR